MSSQSDFALGSAESRVEYDLAQPPVRRHDSWAHQLTAYHFASSQNAAMLNMGMGCGKTKVVVDLVNNQLDGDALILCPKAVCATWPAEWEKHGARDDVEVAVLTGTTREKREQLAERSPRRRVLVVNYDTVWREPLKAAILARRWDMVVCDESQRIKAAGGVASRFCHTLARRAGRRLCLTGTAMPHSPLDLYGQYRFLDDSIFGCSVAAFRARYAETNPRIPQQVVAWKNLDDLRERFFKIAYRVKSEDVLDLPTKTHTPIYCELSKEARRVYSDVKRHLAAEIEAGEITAANAMVKMLRLQQVASGVVRTDDGRNVEIDQSKADALAELLDGIGPTEPVVVFAVFRSDLDQIARVAAGCGLAYGELSGRRNDLDGNRLPPLHNGRRGYVMGVQIKSGGVGLDFTRSAFCVYFTTGYSLGEYEQSIARLHRPGQTRCVRYYHLIGRGTVDELVYRGLQAKREVIEEALGEIVGAESII